MGLEEERGRAHHEGKKGLRKKDTERLLDADFADYAEKYIKKCRLFTTKSEK